MSLNKNQKTLAKTVSLSGIGLHTGKVSVLTIHPASANEGISFQRTDVSSAPVLKIGECETSVNMCTRLGDAQSGVSTVEHILSALVGLQIDNARIEVSSFEVPGMDGSAKEFVLAILEAGIKEHSELTNIAVLRKKIRVSDGDAYIEAYPTSGCSTIKYTLDYQGVALCQGTKEFALDAKTFENEIAQCRTFCLEKEADELRNAGYGKGATTQNTLVIQGETILDTTLRFGDEPLRHKVLDFFGDIAMLGRKVQARFVANKSGHSLNKALVAALKEQIDMDEQKGYVYDIKDIEGFLPHRYPFLLVDKVTEVIPGELIVGYKNVTRNEEFFNGHFPGNPIMPGVLITEALAQCGAILVLHDQPKGKFLPLFAAIDALKFRRQVVPGDKLELRIDVLRLRKKFGHVKATASVDGEVAVACELKFALVDIPAEEDSA